MFDKARELRAFDHNGRRLHLPEIGSWVEFDCTQCGTRTQHAIRDARTMMECSGCEAYAFIPESWSQLAIAPDASIVAEPVQAPEERHESQRLFEPAPTQIEGQMYL